MLAKVGGFVCADPRVRDPFVAHLAMEFQIPIAQITLPSMYGGCLNFINGETQEAAMKQVRTAVDHLGVSDFVVANHTGCLAYAKIAEILLLQHPLTAEARLHERHVLLAVAMIKREFPKLHVHGRLILLDQSGRVRAINGV